MLQNSTPIKNLKVTNKDGEKKTIDVDGLFVAVGRTPAKEEFKDVINLDETGYAVAKEDCLTEKPGIFVAGDNRTKEVRQLITVTSDGAIAAAAAIKYLATL